MPLYESTFILRQDIPVHDIHKITDHFVQIVLKEGGSLVKKEYWGLRTLSYEIRKNKKGHYMLLGLSCDAPAVKNLERQYKIDENVINFMTVKVDSLTDVPSPMMQTPSDLGALGNNYTE
ncbi:30S ribosomal protein S6 [Rickettsiales endosymbiont of Peranema trichophorum]|uniref:30S ribosomal protein S6 n=1 Tax=Rickettsiales endosymbiont of Peranema trichophorum TaxID=2486577 RepID=UPI001022A362|nr:30S ribosomal protein S6 [Rickettsiales endosymbiont of Peranema trichophorum]RZI47749.1 30S ribosomal protein S6 [Rickettsiales endosymbiont of Peranema trichophorum]